MALKCAKLIEYKMSEMLIPRRMRCCVVVRRLGERKIIQIRKDDERTEIIADVDRIMLLALPCPPLYDAYIRRRSSMGMASSPSGHGNDDMIMRLFSLC